MRQISLTALLIKIYFRKPREEKSCYEGNNFRESVNVNCKDTPPKKNQNTTNKKKVT